MSKESVVTASSTSARRSPGRCCIEQRKLTSARCGHLDALRLPGRARGVDDVGEIVRPRRGDGIVGGKSFRRLLGEIDARDVWWHLNPIGRISTREQQGRATVGQHVGQAFGRKAGIERKVGGPRLLDRK